MFHRRWRFLGGVLLAVAIALAILLTSKSPVSVQPSLAQGDRSEIRGVWITNVDSDMLFDSNRLSNAVQELAQLNINTLYPAVWNWGYTTYPSAAAQKVSGAIVDPRPLSLEGRDALAELIKQAHQRGMAVLPWFEFGFMVPEDSAIALRRPDLLTQKKDGDQSWQEGKWPRVWLNPFKPEVQQFILDLVLEVVTRYDVDGIQLDDHFGLPAEFGYDDFTVGLYQQDHQGKSPPANPSDPEWLRWRADRITQFQNRLFRAVKAKKNNVLISLSPNNYPFSYSHSLQDWRTWEQQGYIEELVLQVYRDSQQEFLKELNAPEVQNVRRHIPTAVGVLTGLKQKFVPIQQVQQQVKLIRDQKFAGISFFFYETLWNLVNEPVGDRKLGFKALFPTTAPRPNIVQGWSPLS
jgi:uncharacterized lipoprotein YddW (UPF0748 family)